MRLCRADPAAGCRLVSTRSGARGCRSRKECVLEASGSATWHPSFFFHGPSSSARQTKLNVNLHLITIYIHSTTNDMNRLVLQRTLPVVLHRAPMAAARAAASDAAHNLPPAISRRRQDVLAPFSLNQMMREMDSMFPSFFGEGIQNLPKLAVDVEEKPDRFVIHADVPGMQSKDVKVHLSPDNVLSIEAERTSHHEEGNPESSWHKVERSYGTLHRSFQVPDHVDVNSITAEVKDGVLALNLPKMESAPKHEVRQIPVSGAAEP